MMQDVASKHDLEHSDLKLIEELEKDARQTFDVLADKLNLSRPTVGRKVGKLLKSRAIKIVTLADPRFLGYTISATLVVTAQPGAIRGVAERLVSHPNVHHVMVGMGRFNIIAWVLFRDPSDMEALVMQELGSISGIIKAEAMPHLREVKHSTALLAGCDLYASRRRPTFPLDHLSLRLIGELELEARQSPSRLAAKIGTSPSTVSRRLQRLIDEGVIRIVAIANPASLGYQIVAVVGVKAQTGMLDTVAEAMAAHSKLLDVVVLASRYDIMAWGRFRSQEELLDFVGTDLPRIDGIREIETMLNMSIMKTSFRFLSTGFYSQTADLVRSP